MSGDAVGKGTDAGHPPFAAAVPVWLKIGLLGFGGPAGQIALMHRLLVDELKWVSEARFLNALNFCMLLPGPEAQQLAIYVGWLMHGTRGGLVAGILFVLPGLAVLLVLSALYALFQETAWLATLFFGLKAAVLAVVIEALVRIGRRALQGPAMILLAAAAFIGIFALQVPFPIIVLGAGLLGYLAGRYRPGWLAPSRSNGGPTDAAERPPPQIALGWRRAARIIALCGALWAAPVVLCGLLFGWASVYVTIGTFFSQMAVVTFGGAYAVLAYVAQQAVETLGWLQPGEMLDGLALAETTPGPLILVLVFVGFLAAFRDPTGLAALGGGVAGALLTTWVTFVPCFLWIFLGAPYIERIRGHAALSAALSAITAAVVGVILNLAVWFALHTLFGGVGEMRFGPLAFAWPDVVTIDVAALVLTLAAMAALFVAKFGMVPTLALCAVLGVAIKALL